MQVVQDIFYRLFLGVAYAQVKPVLNDAATLKKELGSNQGYFTQLVPTSTNYTIGGLADLGISIILYAAGIAAVIFLLYSGILYITSAGEETKAEKGRKGVVNAIIGIVIIILAFAIEKSIATILK